HGETAVLPFLRYGSGVARARSPGLSGDPGRSHGHEANRTHSAHPSAHESNRRLTRAGSLFPVLEPEPQSGSDPQIKHRLFPVQPACAGPENAQGRGETRLGLPMVTGADFRLPREQDGMQMPESPSNKAEAGLTENGRILGLKAMEI